MNVMLASSGTFGQCPAISPFLHCDVPSAFPLHVSDDERSIGGAKDQFSRNCGGVVVAAVAAACSGS